MVAPLIRLPLCFSMTIKVLFVISVFHLDYCVCQRNPPQGASTSNNDPNLYVYSRGDIPIFNGPPTGPLTAALRELIIAIR